MYTYAELHFKASVASVSTRLLNSPNPGVSTKLTCHAGGASARKGTLVTIVHFGISF